ncbi:MAG: ribosomal protein S18-alanine N-acetyltransferase [Clostridiales bacterium]|jgi:ribosomal-protein-alanine N-acetyltransferase|nr:ribosomal protein S18-alanine N-acetyltransferase [Clostridiales bacterium]
MAAIGIPEGFEIRSVLPEEAKEASELEKSSLSVPWSTSELTLFINNPHAIYLAAFLDGKMAGICGCYAGVGECQITNVAVEEKHRRKNIALLLIKRLLEEAKKRNCEKAFLEVAENNLPAIRLYEKLGFRVTGRRKGYYRDSDALLMTLEEI